MKGRSYLFLGFSQKHYEIVGPQIIILQQRMDLPFPKFREVFMQRLAPAAVIGFQHPLLKGIFRLPDSHRLQFTPDLESKVVRSLVLDGKELDLDPVMAPGEQTEEPGPVLPLPY